MANAIVTVPAQAKRGDIIEIKTLVRHAMETGFRRTPLGALIPRDVMRSFVGTYNGAEIFSAALHPPIAAIPYLTFTTVATESRTIAFKWVGDNGFAVTETAAITVT